MIIKSMSRKSMSFGQLLDYINAPESSGPVICQNLRTSGDDPAMIRRDFQDNARLLPPRKNGNLLYHEMLAVSDLDQAAATPEVLAAIARRYLDLRAPYALAYGRAHYDTECPHVHLMISANNVGSSKRLRLSRQRFNEIKKELEAYQREYFPQLEHSVVIFDRSHSRHKNRPLSRNESERRRRLRKAGEERMSVSEKERVRQTFLRELSSAISGDDLAQRLEGHSLRLYRRGLTIAVEDRTTGRRYRLKTLGLEKVFNIAQHRWQVIPDRRQGLEQHRRGREPPELTR